MMKKILFGLFILVAGYIGYALLKPIDSKEKIIKVDCTEAAIMRNFMKVENWQNWWPGKQIDDTTFNYRDINYVIKNLLANGVMLQVKSTSNVEYAYLQVTALNDTSSNVIFNIASSKPTSFSEKIFHPFSTNEIGSNILLILDSVKRHFNDPVNIYGFKAAVTKVNDPHLISIKKQYIQYPTTEDIYKEVINLQAYALTNGAFQTNPPMLNVHISDEGKGVDAMIAIPVNNALPAKDNFQPKFMIQGLLLHAQIVGGAAKVQNAISQFQNYLQDYKLSAPAIPYQSLVTDRTLESDSNKWVTNIYQPIFRK